MNALEKIPVLNPLTLRNKVGEELADIFESQGIYNFEERIGIQDLRSKEKLSKRVLEKASNILNNEHIIEYLSNFQEEYLAEKPRYKESYNKARKTFNRLKGIIPLLRGEFTEGYDILDDILDFFGVDTAEEILEQSKNKVALFRTQNNIDVDSINLYGWLRRGELDFYKLNLANYDESKLIEWLEKKEWKNNLENTEYFKGLPSTFSDFGVGLVFTPFLTKTVYGAIRWIDNKTFIQISDRNRDLASCWFTLFHEIGHIIKHKNTDIYEGEINELKSTPDKREREANKFANEYLFNGDDLRKAVFDRKRKGLIMTADALSKEFKVSPIFTSYWLRKAQYNACFQSKIYIEFNNDYQ